MLYISDTKLTDEEVKTYFEEKEILYREFKSKEKVFLNCNYESLPKKKDSYNAEKKTIIIYVPKAEVFKLARKLADIRIKNLIDGYDIETKEDFEEYKEVFEDYAFNANEFMNCLREKEYVDEEYIAVVKEFKEEQKAKVTPTEKFINRKVKKQQMTEEQYKIATEYTHLDINDCLTITANTLYKNEYVKLSIDTLKKYNRSERKSYFTIKIKNRKYKIQLKVTASQIINLIDFKEIEEHFKAVNKAVNYINNIENFKIEYYCGTERIKELREEIHKSREDIYYFMYLEFIENEMILANTSNDVTADYIL